MPVTERVVARLVLVVMLLGVVVVAVDPAPRRAPAAVGQSPAVYAAEFSPRSGKPGTTVLITGQCIDPGGQRATHGDANVTRDADGRSVGAVDMDADDALEPNGDEGRFSGELVISADATPGPYTMTIRASRADAACSPPGHDALLQAPFTVTSATSTSPMSISPTSGGAGAVIHVTGSDCPARAERIPGAEYVVTVVFLVGPIPTGVIAGVGHPGDIDGQHVVVEPDGSWTTELTVKREAPPGPAGVYADCTQQRAGSGTLQTRTVYMPVPFTVERTTVSTLPTTT